MCIKKRNLLRLVSLFQIPVTPLSNWSVPKEHNNTCLNVVKEVSGLLQILSDYYCRNITSFKSFLFFLILTQVEFIIGYTARGELMYANVNVVLADADSKELLLQTHSVRFQVR